jgi:hypothetical protein
MLDLTTGVLALACYNYVFRVRNREAVP